MKVTIYNNEEAIFDKLSNIKNINDNFYKTLVTNFNEDNFKGWYKEHVFENFKIGFGSIKTIKGYKISFNIKGESIEMLFNLRGKFTIHIPEIESKYFFNSNSHNINFYSNTKGFLECGSSESFIVRLNLSPLFFIQYLPDDIRFDDFKKIISDKKFGKLNSENCLINSRMHFLIKEVIASEWDNHFRKIHITSKILDLLLLQLYQFTPSTPKKNTTKLTTTEANKIERVYEYILNNYTSTLTLSLLCKEIGTNEYALKKGFKTTFGITVFKFIANLRMNKAKELLLKGHTVNEVSEKVSYKNPQHFSTAFKKKFGTSPSKFLSELSFYDIKN
ncbi:AraC family transcriptional regulator [Tenacibaculum sp. XPcli2-G]|uniref:helix-turn-helix transcriptional regulator n=1 Tax=Tenacibaculum sp. XPcli2-G TaxID=2954503 RepID=UPI00209731F7|nr:AraC family transcriptional regulator [Tenacibaculum sp. XPcli2-G]MCO7186251.1 AraC family transcriptional regulator [Tenacibaculum sp. XPcli2-G]